MTDQDEGRKFSFSLPSNPLVDPKLKTRVNEVYPLDQLISDILDLLNDKDHNDEYVSKRIAKKVIRVMDEVMIKVSEGIRSKPIRKFILYLFLKKMVKFIRKRGTFHIELNQTPNEEKEGLENSFNFIITTGPLVGVTTKSTGVDGVLDIVEKVRTRFMDNLTMKKEVVARKDEIILSIFKIINADIEMVKKSDVVFSSKLSIEMPMTMLSSGATTLLRNAMFLGRGFSNPNTHQLKRLQDIYAQNYNFIEKPAKLLRCLVMISRGEDFDIDAIYSENGPSRSLAYLEKSAPGLVEVDPIIRNGIEHYQSVITKKGRLKFWNNRDETVDFSKDEFVKHCFSFFHTFMAINSVQNLRFISFLDLIFDKVRLEKDEIEKLLQSNSENLPR